MENVFDLLIILFIIYAFLAPIFRKRIPPVDKKPSPIDYDASSQPKQEKSSQEILREVEELFGYKLEEQEPLIIENYEDILSTDPFEDLHTAIEKQKFEEEVVKKSSTQSKKEKIDEDFKIEAYDYESTIPDIDIEEFDYSKIDVNETETGKKSEEEKTFAIEFSSLDDFKRAVVYKEIFDTPIALRMRNIKWRRNIY